MKTLTDFRAGVLTESSLEGDKHMCASKIMHKEWKEGTSIIGEHAEPDQFGKVSWYKVMFEHGIETVDVDDPNVEVIEEASHMNHKKPTKKYKTKG